MLTNLVTWCVLLVVAIAAVEYFRWLFTTSPGEPLEDDDGEGMKEACRYDLLGFCEHYLAETFYNEFTPRQMETIAGLQSVVLFGGEFPRLMNRAEGATSMIKAAAIWAAAYRHRAFIVVLTDQASSAAMMGHQVDAELWQNERLWEDFPQVDPWPPIGFYSITENLRGVIESNEEGLGIRPECVLADCVLADAIEGGTQSPTERELRRRALLRFVGDLHYRQAGRRPLAFANLIGTERIAPAMPGENLAAGNLRRIYEEAGQPIATSTVGGMTAEELRAVFYKRPDAQPTKAGKAYIQLNVQGDPPAAPRSE